MSRWERVLAGSLLALAVVGGVLMPRLLASPATPLGIVLGPGPGRTVVQAPTIRTSRHRAVTRHASSPLPAATAATTAPVTVRSTPARSVARPKHTIAPLPAPPAATAPAPAPSPAAAAKRPPAPLPPPGQMKIRHGPEMTPPGHAKIPPGHAKTPPGHGSPSPGAPTAARDTGDLPGSGHGRSVPQAPPHPMGDHHRGVGHLATPPGHAAAAAAHARAQARAEARSARGKGPQGPPPQVAALHGHGNGKGGD